MREPLLVTGSHRSGTTWVGRMLCATGEAGYIHEPFNPRRSPGWAAGRVPHWYQFVNDANGARFEPFVEEVLAYRYPVRRNLPALRRLPRVVDFVSDLSSSLRHRLRRPRPLLKDPIALFAAPWLARRYGTRAVVMVRHPAAFAGSLKRLDWAFPFDDWLRQERLMADLLHPFEADLWRSARPGTDILDQAIVVWRAIHHVIAGYRRQHPSWVFVRHEDLALAPVTGFRRLYDELGLRWTERAGAVVERYSAAGNPREVPAWRHRSIRRDSRRATSSWSHRLSADEVRRIRAGVEDVSCLFYNDQEW